jgi:hypothetical protein
VISYHPLSEYKKKDREETYRDDNKAFNKILINQVLVDAYNYKTMLGTQYHPQYTYNDLETSIVFDYLVRQLIAQMTVKKGMNVFRFAPHILPHPADPFPESGKRVRLP